MSLDAILARIDAELETSLDRLMTFLRIPSISTDPAYKADCQSAADWLVAELASLGVEAEARPTPGHPMVVGHVGEGSPHVLFYGHYDVQPVDPLNLWNTPPFEPVIQDTPNGKVIRGRGTADDKGQLMTFVEACRAWKAVTGEWPCRVTFLFEGEEETGSPSLIPFLEANKEELSQPDIALICDTSRFDKETPAIVTSLRGLVGEGIDVTAAGATLERDGRVLRLELGG